MGRGCCLLIFFLGTVGLIPGATEQTPSQDADVVFRSDVSLVRVDAQVLDRNNRALTGLHAEDFILREEGQPQQIRNFESEEMPVDVLLLLDVSGSMRPHVERIAAAAHQALAVLGAEDRVSIMVFDRSTRIRLPFRTNRQEVQSSLDAVVREESFNGGTDITRALMEASRYVSKEARREARRAIVILTDDRTERGRDEAGVSRALAEADAVLSALLAPDAMRGRSGYPGSPGGGAWPGGGSAGGSLGDIIFGRRRGPYGGGGRTGPVILGPQTASAGTAEIARSSGGDAMSVDDAEAFETTLARMRQRYALHFYLPDGTHPGQERNITVELASAAGRRYPGAEVQYRRTYLSPGGAGASDAVLISHVPDHPQAGPEDNEPPRLKRRKGVSEASTRPARGPVIADAERTTHPRADAQDMPAPRGGWRRVDEAATPADTPPATQPDAEPGRWRKLEPGEEP